MTQWGETSVIWRRVPIFAALAIFGFGLTMLSVQPMRAAQANSKDSQSGDSQPRTILVSLSKGQTYVLSGFRGNAKIKVIENTNALAIQTNEPGKVVLVGSDNGSWKFNLTLDSGEKVAYVITVHAAGPPQGSLVPGAAPTVIP